MARGRVPPLGRRDRGRQVHGVSLMKFWWFLPLWRTLHIAGMVMLMGVVAAVDLRIFGVAKGLPLRPLQRLMPWVAGGFAVSLVSGAVLVRANPEQYLGPPLNLAFYAKILCVVLVGLNDILYFATGLKREVDGVDAGEAASASAKIVSVVSLTLWFSVIYLGITLPFFGTGP
jgi:hypothetical protein